MCVSAVPVCEKLDKHVYLCILEILFVGCLTHFERVSAVPVCQCVKCICHQCYCAGLSLLWGLNLQAVVCGIF